MLTPLKLSNASKSKGTVAVHIRIVSLGSSSVARCSCWLREYRLEVLPGLHWRYIDYHRYNLAVFPRGEVLHFPAYWTPCCK
jgi:hypothetical protein